MHMIVPLIGLQVLGARDVNPCDCKPAKDTFACMLHVFEACRLFLFVAQVGLWHYSFNSVLPQSRCLPSSSIYSRLAIFKTQIVHTSGSFKQI
ncbi:unnamed protein product [Ixodes pacificus]